jgi:hypothetical protein
LIGNEGIGNEACHNTDETGNCQKMRANLVFVRILITYRLSKAKEKVNKKILAIIIFFC